MPTEWVPFPYHVPRTETISNMSAPPPPALTMRALPLPAVQCAGPGLCCRCGAAVRGCAGVGAGPAAPAALDQCSPRGCPVWCHCLQVPTGGCRQSGENIHGLTPLHISLHATHGTHKMQHPPTPPHHTPHHTTPHTPHTPHRHIHHTTYTTQHHTHHIHHTAHHNTPTAPTTYTTPHTTPHPPHPPLTNTTARSAALHSMARMCASLEPYCYCQDLWLGEGAVVVGRATRGQHVGCGRVCCV